MTGDDVDEVQRRRAAMARSALLCAVAGMLAGGVLGALIGVLAQHL